MIANKHRLALVTWAVVYPVITAVVILLDPIIGDLPIPLRTLALTLVAVPLVSYAAMPFATSRLTRWLRDAADSKRVH